MDQRREPKVVFQRPWRELAPDEEPGVLVMTRRQDGKPTGRSGRSALGGGFGEAGTRDWEMPEQRTACSGLQIAPMPRERPARER
jgi:hypothetical protein